MSWAPLLMPVLLVPAVHPAIFLAPSQPAAAPLAFPHTIAAGGLLPGPSSHIADSVYGRAAVTSACALIMSSPFYVQGNYLGFLECIHMLI